MKADIYYDDLGKDMRREEIPEDMRELARNTASNCSRQSPILTTRSWRCILRAGSPREKL
jgi:hypothetical protein